MVAVKAGNRRCAVDLRSSLDSRLPPRKEVMPKLVKAAGGALRVIRLGAPRPGPKTVARSPIASNSESTMVAASLALLTTVEK